MEKLATLPPVFDRGPTGTITAGNSSPLTDGAASVLLMSEERARKEGREPLAFIKAFEFVGINPEDGLLTGVELAWTSSFMLDAQTARCFRFLA